jgi:hypothetical protein
MYDPELALQKEQDLIRDKVLLERVSKRLGSDHPWTKRIKLMTDIFQTLSQKEDDLDNCFDPDVQYRLENEIDELIRIAREVLKKS